MKPARVSSSTRSLAAGAATALFGIAPSVYAADARPDMSGVYMQRGAPVTTPYELTPEGQVALDRNRKAIAEGNAEIDTALKCLPTGFPRMLFGPLPFYLFQTPKAVGIIAETDPLSRIIYLDSEHRGDYWPTYMGDSVGHWEGDTLVVTTVKLVTTTFADMRGLPHSDALRVVERMRLIENGRVLENKVLMEDPKIFKAPWTMTYNYARRDDLKPVENVCENERDRP